MIIILANDTEQAVRKVLEPDFQRREQPISYRDSLKGGFEEGEQRKKPNGEIQTLMRLPIEDLAYTPGNKIYEDKVLEYVSHPPEAHPEALKVGGDYVLEDGNHRVAAAADRGDETILVWVGDVPDWEQRNHGGTS